MRCWNAEGEGEEAEGFKDLNVIRKYPSFSFPRERERESMKWTSHDWEGENMATDEKKEKQKQKIATTSLD